MARLTSPLFLPDLMLLPLFRGVGEADLRLLLGDAWISIEPDGTMLLRQGELSDCFYLLLDGHVSLELTDGGQHHLIDIAGRGEVLGETALIPGMTAEASLQVVGHARLLVVPAAPFLAALEQRFDLAQRLLASMAMRLRRLVEQITRLKLHSAAQRLAGFLLGLARAEHGAARVRFPYDKKLAADRLGMSAETLSRALLRLTELGVESHSDNLVVIADLDRLRAFCSGEETPA